MKKLLLLFFFINIAAYKGNAQSLINYSATLFYNSTNNTVQVTFYVQNTNNGNGVWVDLAGIQFSLRYNTTYFTLSSYNMYPSGSGLDAAGDSNSDQPDATSTTSVTVGAKNYQSLNISRSTNICNNVLRLAPGSSTYPVFVATLQLTSAGISNGYDFSIPLNNNYPAEFQVAGSPTTTKRDILFLASSSADQNGTSNSCSDGNIKLKSLTDDPSTPTVFTNTNGPLPVKWLSFNAIKQNSKVTVTWQTASELNNKGFEVQRKDGNSFKTVAFVPTKSNDGNSAAILDYSISGVGLSMLDKTSYYRIKQVGLDNTSSFSEIRSVTNNSRKLDLLLYPNPSRGAITLVVPNDLGDINISINDLSGKTILVWNNYNKQILQVNDLAKGFYLLNVRSNQTGEAITQKLTIY